MNMAEISKFVVFLSNISLDGCRGWSLQNHQRNKTTKRVPHDGRSAGCQQYPANHKTFRATRLQGHFAESPAIGSFGNLHTQVLNYVLRYL